MRERLGRQLTHLLQAYSAYALASPGRAKVVACAEPRPKTRAEFSARHAIDATLVFDSWQALRRASEETLRTVGKRLADAVLVTVQDHMHEKVVRAFAALGGDWAEKSLQVVSGDICTYVEMSTTPFLRSRLTK